MTQTATLDTKLTEDELLALADKTRIWQFEEFGGLIGLFDHVSITIRKTGASGPTRDIILLSAKLMEQGRIFDLGGYGSDQNLHPDRYAKFSKSYDRAEKLAETRDVAQEIRTPEQATAYVRHLLKSR